MAKPNCQIPYSIGIDDSYHDDVNHAPAPYGYRALKMGFGFEELSDANAEYDLDAFDDLALFSVTSDLILDG